MYPKKPVVILLSGKAGVGKTTASGIMERIISEDHSNTLMGVETLHFAQGVKDTARISFGWNGKKDGRGRKLLQDVGGVGREYWNPIWAEQTVQKVWELMADDNVTFLVDDWRFPNEYLWMLKTDWSIFTVRIDAPKREILYGTPQYDDVSETSLSDMDAYYDFVVDNSDNLNEGKLTNALEGIIKEISSEVDYYGDDE